jgi:hypothetical protein
MSLDLTLVTVSFKSRPFLELNEGWLRRLNPGEGVEWIVAENSPAGAGDRLEPGQPGFRVVEGARYEERPYGAVSYHHAAGLARALEHVRTRFALVLDPDFFVVRPGWLQALLAHVAERRLCFFGAPWNPRHSIKVRYFPCAHFLLVDGQRVPLRSLDFSPAFDGTRSFERPAAQGTPAESHASLELALARGTAESGARFKRLRRLDPLRLRARREVESANDTGFRIQRRYRDDPAYPSECLVPVFRPKPHASRWLEPWLPERWSLLPKRPGYFSTAGFAERGWPDARGLDCEEFLWGGEPFAFHARCYPRRARGRDPNAEVGEIEKLLIETLPRAQGAAAP